MRPTIVERAASRHAPASPWDRRAGDPLTGRSTGRDYESAWRDHEDRTRSDDRRGTPSGGNRRVETDGGAMDDDDDDTDAAFTAYISDEYCYRIEYPAGWAAELDPPGGMFFRARTGGASTFVFVDDETEDGVSLDDYVDDFFCELAADEYIHDLERREERATTLPSGHSGTVVEYTYTDDAACEQWCCTYCFAIADGTGYIVGVEWEATEAFAARATRIIDSFALAEDTHNESDANDHRDAADSRSSTQRTEDDQ